MELQRGDQCFLRCTLHTEGKPTIERGERGIIERLVGSVATVRFSVGKVTIDHMEWLEPFPGTFSRGFAALTSTPNGIWKVGMICSDIKFPEPGQAQYQLFRSNRKLLLTSGAGASFYDGISALNILGSFYDAYQTGWSTYTKSSKLGLIVCEHVWPWGTESRPAFHLRVVNALVAQMSTIPKIMVLRFSDAEKIRRELAAISRVELLDGADFQGHYQPLRMDWDNAETNPIYGAETAIYIKPSLCESHHTANRPLHIPREVLLQMFKGKQTLFLAAGTCDSPVACHKYLLQQLRLHNIPPPNR